MNKSLDKNHKFVDKMQNRKVDITYENYHKAIVSFTDPLNKIIKEQDEEIQRLKNEILFLKSKLP